MRIWRLVLAATFCTALPLGGLAENCEQFEPRLAFCGAPDTWTKRQSSNSNVTLALRRGTTFRANFIFGDAGTDYGDSAESIHEFQRRVYADYTGAPLSSLVIQVEEPVMVDGYAGLRRAFPIQIDQTPFVVALTVIVRPEENLQILTLDAGTRFIARHRAWHDEILSLTRLTLESEG